MLQIIVFIKVTIYDFLYFFIKLEWKKDEKASKNI